MKLSTGKRIGQSGQELLTATVFSFVLHVCTVAAVALFYISSVPRFHAPPSYSVKLVGLPSEAPAANAGPPASPAPTPPPANPPVQHTVKPAPKPKPAPVKQHKAPAPVPKNAMPELGKAKPKPEKTEAAKPVQPSSPEPPAPAQQAAGKPGPAGSTGTASGTKVSGVGLPSTGSSQQDFKFSWYLALVRDKISQNWRASPDAPDARVRVIFTVNRSGWVGDVNVVEDQTKCTYGFKLSAIRAIRSSNPFPSLPDDFAKQTLEFSVDLTPND